MTTHVIVPVQTVLCQYLDTNDKLQHWKGPNPAQNGLSFNINATLSTEQSAVLRLQERGHQMPHQIITIPSAHSSYEVDLYPETLTVLIRQRDVNNKDRCTKVIMVTFSGDPGQPPKCKRLFRLLKQAI